MVQYPERQRILFPIFLQVVIRSKKYLKLLDFTRKHESPPSTTFLSHNSFIHRRENKLTNMHVVYTYFKNVTILSPCYTIVWQLQKCSYRGSTAYTHIYIQNIREIFDSWRLQYCEPIFLVSSL